MNRQGMGRRRLATGLEADVVYAREMYAYLRNNRPLVKFAKRAVNRRERARPARRAIRNEENQ